MHRLKNVHFLEYSTLYNLYTISIVVVCSVLNIV